MKLQPGEPLVALFRLVHLRIPLPFLVLGGTGRCDEGCIDVCALPLRHAPRTEVGLDGFKNLLPQAMLLQQMAKGQDRRFIRNPIADQIDTGKETHDGYLDQGLLHRRIAE